MLNIGGEQVLMIDSDSHVIENESTWAYLGPSEEPFRPRLVQSATEPGQQCWLLDGKEVGFRPRDRTEHELVELSESTGREMRTSTGARELTRADQRLEQMDQVGIDVQVMHNSLWLSQVTVNPDAELALCRSYNRWMGNTWAQDKERLRWTCLPPTLSITDAVKEVRWCKENGAVGISLRPLEGDRHLTDPYFFPIYEEAQSLDLPITVHIANACPAHVELVKQSLFWRFRVPTVAACHTYLKSDVPEQFPKLRVGFIEAGAQWLVWVLEGVVRVLNLPMNATLDLLAKKRVWIACEYEDHLPYIIQYAGEDQLIIGTDFGHTDPFSNVKALNTFVERTDVTNGVKKKIVKDNAEAFFGL